MRLNKLYPWKQIDNAFLQPIIAKQYLPHIENGFTKLIYDRMNFYEQNNYNKANILIGPPGCGKTSSVIRAAIERQKKGKRVIYISEYNNFENFFGEDGKIGFYPYLKNKLGMKESDDVFSTIYDLNKITNKQYTIILDNADQLFKIKKFHTHVTQFGEMASNSGIHNYIFLMNNPKYAMDCKTYNIDKANIMIKPLDFKLPYEFIKNVFKDIQINESVKNYIIDKCAENGTIGFVDKQLQQILHTDNISFADKQLQHILNTDNVSKTKIEKWSWDDYKNVY
jgi:hypothetical protein